MNINLVARPAATQGLARCLPWPSCPAIVGRRHESSFRRTKKRLGVKPDPSFTLTQSSPQQDHIIFNPPSSAPSVYHTPHKFLPKEDRRRDLISSAPLLGSSSQERLPPTISGATSPYQKRYHLVEEDFQEIRRLRIGDPVKYSRGKLAKMFKCSPLFIALLCGASREHKDAQLAKLDEIKAKWGRRRTLAREDRARRRETWGRDDELQQDSKYLRLPGLEQEKERLALAESQDVGDGR